MLRGSLRRAIVALGVVVLAAGSLFAVGQSAAAKGQFSRRASVIHLLHRVGPIGSLARRSPSVRANLAGPENPLDPELYRVHSREGQELEGGDAIHEGEQPAPHATVTSGVSGTGGGTSFDALNHFDSRYSDGGNQFSGEPPDQGLCASGNREFEIVNSVVQVYTASGHALIAGTPGIPGTAPVGLSLNEFFGVPTSFVRPDGPFGPFVFDVSCQYDRAAKRWFVLADWLSLDPKTGDFSGPAGFYIAVSRTPRPLGSFDVYSVDTTNNGKNGTPNHHCSSGFCFGDYPHMAIDKACTRRHHERVRQPGRRRVPRRAAVRVLEERPDQRRRGADDGRDPEHLLPRDERLRLLDRAGRVVAEGLRDRAPRHDVPRDVAVAVRGRHRARHLAVASDEHGLDRHTPNLHLVETSIPTDDYAAPPSARQKPGDTPLLDCENDPNCIGAANPVQQGPWPLDAGDGTVGGGWLRNGVVYLVAGAALAGNGGALIAEDGLTWSPIPVHAGVAYWGLRPGRFTDHVGLVFQGAAAVTGQNITYPSIAMNGSGKGAIGATLVGPNVYPSASYLPFNTAGPSGSVVVAGAGAGPNDGFTATFDGAYRTRWGDYGEATVAPGGTVWLASEYINQTCNDVTFNADRRVGTRARSSPTGRRGCTRCSRRRSDVPAGRARSAGTSCVFTPRGGTRLGRSPRRPSCGSSPSLPVRGSAAFRAPYPSGLGNGRPSTSASRRAGGRRRTP